MKYSSSGEAANVGREGYVLDLDSFSRVERQGLGSRVWGVELSVQGLGSRVWGVGLSVQGLGSRVWGVGLSVRVWGPESGV